jgi:hypothetical protein
MFECRCSEETLMGSVNLLDVAVALVVWVMLVVASLVASTAAVAVFEYFFEPLTGRLLQLIYVAVTSAVSVAFGLASELSE